MGSEPRHPSISSNAPNRWEKSASARMEKTSGMEAFKSSESACYP
jgi:hypothetical protein